MVFSKQNLSCQNSFVPLNVEEIGIGLNSCFVFFCFCLFNMHLKKESVLTSSISILLKKTANKKKDK